jgi:hypothetical protein
MGLEGRHQGLRVPGEEGLQGLLLGGVGGPFPQASQGVGLPQAPKLQVEGLEVLPYKV